jgi:hypothetical protein
MADRLDARGEIFLTLPAILAGLPLSLSSLLLLLQFYDSRFAASSEGREVTRVESTGTVRVTIQVLTRGMASHGFSTGGPPDLADAESEGEFVSVSNYTILLLVLE